MTRKIIDLTKIYEQDLDMFCELIRTCVFQEHLGCYSCFDLVEGFEEQDPKKIPLLIRTLLAGSSAKNSNEISRMCWYKDSERQLDVYWYWDGDGTLVFQLPDGTIVYNTDCKCSYDWSNDIRWAEECLTVEGYYYD